jgi:hypothetical protein
MLEDDSAKKRELSMALKFKLKSKDEVPAEHLFLYTERDGAWLLDVDGAVEKAKLDELRTNTAALTKERDELKQRFDGIDPDEARAVLADKQKLEQEKQLKAGEVEKVVEGRIKAVKADLEKQVGALTTERDSLNSRLTAIQIDQGVITVATKRGLRPTAIADITSRARTVFKLVNGAPAAFEGDGKSVRYGRDGLTPMTLEEWVDTQVSEAPHLFESNAGAGGVSAQPPGRSGGLATKNPYRKDTWNLTEQMRLLKSDPQLASRLKAAA